VYFLMDCLNGFSQDVYTESLAESLLLAPHGGAERRLGVVRAHQCPLGRSSINPSFGRSLETRGPWAPRCWRRNCWSPIPTFVAPGSRSAIRLCASGGLPNIEPDVQRGDFFCRRSGTQHQTFPSSLGPRKQLEAQFIIGEALRQLGQ
jgi:hypothetical protein